MIAAGRLRRPGLVAVSSFLLLSLAGTATGFAATRPADVGKLHSMEVSSCRAAPVTVGFETAYDERLAGYGVGSATVAGLDDDTAARCAGMRFNLALADVSGDRLSQTRGVVPASTGTFAVDLADAHVLASDVASVRLTIGG